MALDSTRTISGNFGSIYEDGVWLTNFTAGNASGEISYEKIKRVGTRKMGNKAMSIDYTGSISGYKITSELARKVAQINDDRNGAFVTDLIMKLDDPEAYGFERVRLKNVQFTTINIIGFEHGTIIEEEWPFVFDDFEWLDAISE